MAKMTSKEIFKEVVKLKNAISLRYIIAAPNTSEEYAWARLHEAICVVMTKLEFDLELHRDGSWRDE